MKLTFNRSALETASALAAGVALERSTRPILRLVRLCTVTTLGDDKLPLTQLMLCASDGDTSLSQRVNPTETTLAPLDLCVPGKKFAECLKSLPGELVVLEQFDGLKLRVSAGDDVFEFVCQDSTDFPEPEAWPEKPGAQVLAGDLLQALSRTIFAAARDQGRYAINGVYFDTPKRTAAGAGAGAPELVIVATNGRVLAKATLGEAAEFFAGGVIVPTRAAKLLEKLCGVFGESAPVHLIRGARTLQAACGGTLLTAQQIEGNFPQYQQIIALEIDRGIEAESARLLASLARANVMANSENNNAVELEIGAGFVRFVAQTPECGKCSVSTQAELFGEPLKMSVSGAYLSSGIKQSGAEKIRLEAKAANRPIVISAANYTFVQMPISPKE